MRRLVLVVAVGVAFLAGTALAHSPNRRNSFRVGLDGYQEVPAALSTTGSGALAVHVARDGDSLGYALRYRDLEGSVQQAHIHLGRPSVNGGIMVFLCTNLGNGPAGTPPCPGPNDGEVSGTVDAADVVGPAGQGIAAGEFDEVVAALRDGAAYGNVHTDLYAGGEIRGNFSQR
jgi:hypothetical protein